MDLLAVQVGRRARHSPVARPSLIDIPTRVEAIPSELRDCPQWVAWLYEQQGLRVGKVPIDIHSDQALRRASVSNSSSWGTFDAAVAYASYFNLAGVGFVFTDQDSYVGVDLDGCRDPSSGAIDSRAQRIIERLGGYTEVSVSGTGVHIIVRGKLPRGPRRTSGIELYEEGRFFATTGDFISQPECIPERTEQLHQLHAELFGSPPGIREPRLATEMICGTQSLRPQGLFWSDRDVLESASHGRSGKKFVDLFYSGEIHGYPSQSEADLALCAMLALRTGDPVQVDRLFRRSALYRPKWNERHAADGRSYGQLTITTAFHQKDQLAAAPTWSAEPIQEVRPTQPSTAKSEPEITLALHLQVIANSNLPAHQRLVGLAFLAVYFEHVRDEGDGAFVQIRRCEIAKAGGVSEETVTQHLSRLARRAGWNLKRQSVSFKSVSSANGAVAWDRRTRIFARVECSLVEALRTLATLPPEPAGRQADVGVDSASDKEDREVAIGPHYCAAESDGQADMPRVSLLASSTGSHRASARVGSRCGHRGGALHGSPSDRQRTTCGCWSRMEMGLLSHPHSGRARAPPETPPYPQMALIVEDQPGILEDRIGDEDGATRVRKGDGRAWAT